WLNKSYGDWKGIKKTNTLQLTQEILLETVHDNDITQAPTTHTNDANTTAPEPGPIPTATAPAETATIPAVQLDSGANPQRVTRFGPTQQPATAAPIPRWQQDLRTWDTDRHGTQPILRTRTQTRLATANSESGRETATRETATRVRTTEVPTEEEEEIDFTGDQSGPLFNENDVANMMMNPDLQWPDLALQVTEEMMENIVENKEAEDTNYKEPKNFQEAWNHPDKYQRDKWREAIRKEFCDMIRRGVWRKMKRRDLPYGRRCIKCKWVFKIKRNGVFRSRLVACGYSQIPGVDFTEHFAPVINDITWRILLVAMMIWKLDAWLIDVETAFLHGEFDEGEQIFMNLPVGYDLVDSSIDMSEDCIELMKTAYGTVQGARQWWKKFVSILKDIGFEGGDADPCLMHWNSEHGIVFIGLYVDDCLCIGKPEALELVEAKLKEKGLTLKTEKTLKDYLSCDVSFNEDRTKAVLRQPHLLKTLEEDFGEMVRNMPKYKTPGTPGQGLVCSEEGVTVTPEEQKQFRSGTGKLLYLVKHTRPDIANAVRELSKVLDSTTPRAMKEMKRIIKHVLDTKGLGLKIEPVIGSKGLLWNVVAFSDSDYAGDPDSRKSVSGFIVYLCGVPICWRSKAQRTVTLSSAEAEWIALSEVAKEVLFIAQILETMGVKVEYPIVIRVDNTAAIFMATNVTTNQRTRHVDIRTKFVTQYTGPDGILKILFVKGTDNESDIMTKNVTGNLHEKHIPKMMTNIDEGTTK
ncbi:unnamed protein product, partial [Cylindrotheca closterium]